MGTVQVKQEVAKRGWWFYLISGLSFLLTAMSLVAVVYFQEEIRHIGGYGYLGVFIAGVLCGITIIPAPTLMLVFTLGHVLDPIYVGLVAGFGGALGGITVYMTGAGVGSIVSGFRTNYQAFERRLDINDDISKPTKSRFWFKGEAFYNLLAGWVRGRRGTWVVFIVSAMIISPFYFTGLAAGSLNMGLLRFFLISWVGKTVRYLTVAFAGYWGLQFLLKWIGG